MNCIKGAIKVESNLRVDVTVIGKGIAGLSAAIGAVMKGASVVVVSDSNVSSTVLAEKGVFRLVKDTEAMYSRIKEYGQGLSKEEILSTFTKLLNDVEQNLQSIFNLEIAEHVGKKVKGGGPEIAARLEALARKLGVNFVDGKVIKIITENNRVSAIQFLWYPKLLTIQTGALVIACGGIGSIYSRSDNSKSITIPGCSLALDAGVKLRDIEFTIFHPCGAINNHSIYNTVPIFTFFDIAGKPLYNSNGERLPDIEDLVNTGLAHKLINEIAYKVQKVGAIYLKSGDGDVILKPVYHSLIGGIDADENFQTSVEGLFAAGESLGGLNGANRMAGMALLEGFVLGRKAGENSADYSSKHGFNHINEENLILRNLKYGSISGAVINRIHAIADTALFIEREESQLIKCEDELNSIMRSIPRKTCAQYIEHGIALMALAVAISSRMRKESRGAFFRSDYTKCDSNMEYSFLLSSNGEGITCERETK